jgi:hypothetical protein
MAETKYGKYFLTYDVPPEQAAKSFFGDAAMARFDGSVMEGSNMYWAHWYLPHEKPLAPGYPHIHKYAEILMWFGSDPDNPLDLGAELEMHMGPELEKHIITKSTVVFLPPYFVHCPWIPLRAWRPWLFIGIHQGPVHTIKPLRQLLTREAREELKKLGRLAHESW